MADAAAGRLYLGDNLAILRGEVSGAKRTADSSVDFVYLDPPFNSARSYLQKSQPGQESVAFTDTWRWNEADYRAAIEDNGNGRPAKLLQAFRESLGECEMSAYLVMMAPRLAEFHRVLGPTGSLVLHCDPTASHYLKLMLDQVFGPRNYLNEIVWHYGGRGAKAIANRFGRNHDVLLYYAKEAGNHRFERQYGVKALTVTEAYDKGYRKDVTGRWYKTAPRGDYTDASVEQLRRDGRIYETRNGTIRVKYFLRHEGKVVYEESLLGDTWNDIADAMHLGKERNGYPTQKPLALLERILSATTAEGDLVLDPFAGSGTTLVAAEKMGRRWIGIDSSEAAVQSCRERLAAVLTAGSKG
jgi:DNA modification methylase